MCLHFEPSVALAIAQLLEQKTGSRPDERDLRRELDQARDLNLEALHLYEQGKFREALPLAREGLKIREQLLGQDHLEVADSLRAVGLISTWLADLQEARSILERVLRIREQLLSPSHLDVAECLTNLGRVYTEMGELQRSEQVLLRALQIRGEQLGSLHPDFGVTLTYLTHVRFLKGDLQAAKAGYEQTIAIFRGSPSARPGEYGWALNGLAYVRQNLGDIAGARRLVDQALHVRETTLGSSHPQVTVTLAHLVELMQHSGELEAALPLAERVVHMDEQVFGNDHPRVALRLNSLADLKRHLGNVGEARRLRERALDIQRRALGLTHYLVADALIELALLYDQRTEMDKAIELVEQAIDIQEQAFGHDTLYVSASLDTLGWLLTSRGSYTQAKSVFERGLTIRQQFLPPGHPDLEISFVNLARLLDKQGALDGARAYYEEARRLSLAIGLSVDLDDPALRSQWEESTERLKNYIKLLVKMIHTKPDSSAVTDAFLVADQVRGWIVQAAVAKAMARQEAGNTDQIEVSRRVDGLRRDQKALWNRLAQFYGKPAEPVSQKELLSLKASAQRVQQELDAALAKLESIAPRYAEVYVPKPIEGAAVQQLLHQDEALVSYYTMNDHLLIWLLKPDQPLVFRDITVPRTKLDTLLKRVRGSISSDYLSFDVESSFELFSYLIAPVLPGLQGVRNLIVVPDQFLLPLPFSVLLTDDTQDAFRRAVTSYNQSRPLSAETMTDYAELPWLLNKYAVTVLPSASTLRLLRQNPKAVREGREAFIGFGNPDLAGESGQQEITKRLQALEPLPGTRNELEAVAKALQVGAKEHLYLGQRATESELRNLDRSGRLGEARVLFFATHGLLAGELHGLVTQPGLVLTPSGDDDGLLTRDEILILRLPHTSWVVLSACDTGNDRGGEGLSGLVRAFFYAGARSLLVTHWKVKDKATQELMTRVFQRYGQDKALGAAEALRQGTLALLSEARSGTDPHFAHPYAWAPFFVVGDGSPNSVPP